MRTVATTPITANEIADWFLCHMDRESGDSITHLKLQKLVYYAQAWSLALFNEPLFKEELQAWTHGPVAPSVYRKFSDKGFEALPAPKRCKTFEGKIEGLLSEIYNIYGRLTAKDLERLTHGEDPWNIARGGLSPEAASNNIITKESMKKYYKLLLKNAKR